MNKVLILAFQGETMCFVHALLNTLDMKERGFDVSLILEGASVSLIGPLSSEEHPFHALWQRALDARVITAVCRACAAKFKATGAAQALGLSLEGEMSGHPPIAPYIEQGYQIVTF